MHPLLFRPRARREAARSLALAALLFGAKIGCAQTSSPAADPIEGRWSGTITAPQGTVADFGLEFFRAKQGALIFRLYFPAMFTYNVPFGIPVVADGAGNYRIDPAFNISLHLAGDRLDGTFGLGRLPLALHRGGEFAPKPASPVFPPAPAPLWTHDLGAGTWAPPVADGGEVYVGTRDGKFHAVNATDGSGHWVWTGAHGIDGAAVLGPDSVWFIDTGFNLVALDRRDGRLKWSVALHDEKLAGKPAPDNPTFNHRAPTPLLADGILYAGSSDGGLYAIDAATGAKLWRHDAKAPVYSGIARQGSDRLLFGTMDGSVVVLDRRDQHEILRAKTGGGVVTTPLVSGDTIVAGSRDYMLYGFNLSDGSVAWKFSYWFSWIESSPVLRDGVAYIGASDFSRVTAFDPATGRAHWSTPVHGMNWGTPLVTVDRVFTGTASQNLPGTVIAHEGGIVALDRRTGAVVWRLVSPPAAEGEFGGYAGSLALAGDKVIAAGFDGKLIALPAK
ncbi:MAG TPA: PQQ-binding-like beta-propeller repeat protein [Lacunisphaera sp.]|nr:PQQ-binding-like beta-propeller repeat protein [Lacunisphaera sp.]